MPGRVVALAVAVVLAGAAPAPAASWSPQATVIPSGAAAASLRSVSCPTARFCVAVGAAGPNFAPDSALAERWNGATWVVDPVPSPAGGQAMELRDVSCYSRGDCLAVGTARSAANSFGPLAEHWDGSRWTARTPASPPGAVRADLRAVSCPRRRACIAVGVAYFPGPGRYVVSRPLVERWGGSGWTVEPASDPDSSDLSLDDVSCSSRVACTAVGYHVKPGAGQVPLVERSEGGAWTIQDTPAIPDQVYNQFSGVSCPHHRFCEAVGYVGTTTTTRGIAERWDGTAWTLEATPGPLSGPSQLLGVTCAPRGRCSAVGEVLGTPTGTELLLAERRTPRGWVVEPAPLPAAGSDGRLWGVSCSGGGSCTAVGVWGTGSLGPRPLAERRSR